MRPSDGEEQLMGVARLARMAFADVDLGPLRARLLERLAWNGKDANALLELSVVGGMTVHTMDPVEIFPYKPPQLRKVFGAFRQTL